MSVSGEVDLLTSPRGGLVVRSPSRVARRMLALLCPDGTVPVER